MKPSASDSTTTDVKQAEFFEQAALFRKLIWLLVLSMLVVIAALAIFAPPEPWYKRYPIAVMLIATGFLSLHLLNRGHASAAMSCYLWGNTLVVLFQCAITAGVRSPSAMALPIIAVLSAWGGQKHQSTLLSALVISALFVMTLLDSVFWASFSPRPALIYFMTLALTTICGSLLARHLGKALRTRLSQLDHTRNELELRLNELQTERAKFSTFFYLNPVPASISLLADGTYYDINPAWEKLSGWSRDEVRGRTGTEIGIWVTPEERQAWVAEFREQGRTSNLQSRFRLRNGEIRHFLASSEVVEYDGRQCIFAAFVDVTERREAELALQQLNAQLEYRVAERTEGLSIANAALNSSIEQLRQAQEELVHSETLASLGSLVAGVSHELNTPLGNALIVTTTLQDQLREFRRDAESGSISRSSMWRFLDNAGEATGLAVRSLQRATHLLGSFKQVAMDQASERRRSFDLDNVVADVLETLRPTLKHQPIVLSSTVPEGVELDSYPGPLGQVVTNLVQNAAFHGFADGHSGSITVEATMQGNDQVQIRVCDDGHGIDPENIGRIFDPFFTTRLGQGGSGIGLSIVHRMVTTLLGGTISVSSAPGEGTVFTVTLPTQAPQR